MVKTTRELGYEMIAASYVKHDPIFDLTNNLDSSENLRTIKGDFLDEKQHELLTSFLNASDIETANLSHEEIRKISRREIKNKLNLLCEAFENTDVSENHAFFMLNDALYKNINKYLTVIPNSGVISIGRTREIRHEIAKALIIDLRYLEKLFGKSLGLSKYEKRLTQSLENNKDYISPKTLGERLENAAHDATNFIQRIGFGGRVFLLLYIRAHMYVTFKTYDILMQINANSGRNNAAVFNMITSNLTGTCPTDRGFLYGNCEPMMHQNIIHSN